MSNRVIPAGSVNPNATIAPGVVVIESITPGIVSGVPTNRVGFVGTSTYGPVNSPVDVSVPGDYTSNFGNVMPVTFDMGTAVNAACLQGTVGTYVCVRVTDGTDQAAVARLLDNQTLGAAGVVLTAKYTGETANAFQTTVSAGTKPNCYNVSIGRPGYAAELFTNIDSSGSAFWANVISAINNGQSGVRGPSQLAVASVGDGINQVAITAAGSGYTGVPTVSFTGGGGTGAAGTAVLGFPINSIAVNTAGSYATNPTVSVGAPGSGATFTHTMKAVSATQVAGGSGYVANDTITLTGGSSSVATILTVTSVDGGGAVTGVSVSTPGNYTVLPTSPVAQGSTSGSGTGATFTVLWGLLAITVTANGTGYTSASALVVSGGGGTGGATGTITLSTTGIVIGINITNRGTAYASAPTVGFTGGSGTGATATVTIGANNTPQTTSATYVFAGGTNGNSGVTAATLLGADGSHPTGMYALRNSQLSLFALVDCSDSTTFSTQEAFASVTGTQAILVGPPGQTVSAAISDKSTRGLIENFIVYLVGDWCYYLDTNNNGTTRLISPQGFYGGEMANLSPEQSPLNKPIQGILATQKTIQSQQYSDTDYVNMMQSGLDVISNPIPAGGAFGCETGKSGGVDLTNNNVCIQRMANFLGLSLSRSGVLGAFIGDLQTPDVRTSARNAITAFMQNLVDAQQIQDFRVVLDDSNNPNSRVVLGFMQATVQVQLFSVIIVFLIDLNVGTVTIQS
jgi:hypothetical protein